MFCDIRVTYYPEFKVFNDDGSAAGVQLTQELPEFAVNCCGWPLTDIAALNGAKSVQEYELLLSQMSEYIAQNPDNSKLSIADIIACTPSFRLQAPAEVERAATYIGQHWQSKLDGMVEQKRVQIAAQQAQAQKTDAMQVAADAPQT